jgi:hypothetical protein
MPVKTYEMLFIGEAADANDKHRSFAGIFPTPIEVRRFFGGYC